MTKYNFGAKRLWIATVAVLALGAAVTGTIAGQRDNTRETTIRQVSSLDLLTRIPPNSVMDRDVVLVEAEGALYRFDADSTTTADGVTVVSPLGAVGRWHLALARVTGHEPSVVAATVLNPTGLGTPTYGQRWLIAGSGAGGWASQDNKIAQYVTGTKTLAASWRFITPGVGSLVTSTTTGLTYQKASGGTWVGLNFATAIAANAMLVPAVAGTGAQLVLAEPTGGGVATLTFTAPALAANRAITFGDEDYAFDGIKAQAANGNAAFAATDEMLDVAGASGGTLTLLEPVAGGAFGFTMAAPALAAARAITLTDRDYNLTTIAEEAAAATASFMALRLKDNVRVVTAAPLAAYTPAGSVLTADANGALTIDGVAVADADRVLVTLEAAADAPFNGIFDVTDNGDAGTPWILTRATDADAIGELREGSFVWVAEGTLADTRWVVTVAPAVIDVNDLTWSALPSTADKTKIDGVEALADVTDATNVAAAGAVMYTDEAGPRWSAKLAADSTHVEDGIAAAVEVAHTAISLPSTQTGTGRRTIRVHGFIYQDGTNGADTTRIQLRLGGVAGTLLVDNTAVLIATGEFVLCSAYIQIRTTGAGGTFDSASSVTDATAGPATLNVVAGAIDTTGAVALVVTTIHSTNNAANSTTLREWVAEVWDE